MTRDLQPTRWSTLTVELPAELENELLGWLASRVAGVEETPLDGGRSRFVFCLPAGADVGAIEVGTRATLDALGVPRADVTIARGEIEDGQWVERQVASMRPFALGRRFVVRPGEAPVPAALGDRIALRLVPGRAFGTGEHATTRLAVELLEEKLSPGTRWLDVGCGTAILAIVARKLGATEVLGLDNDPAAVAVAREVLQANGVDAVWLAVGTIESARRERWDGVVANVSAAFAREAAHAVAAALVPGGRALLTGFLEKDVPDVVSAARFAGLDDARTAADGPWCAVVATRRVDG